MLGFILLWSFFSPAYPLRTQESNTSTILRWLEIVRARGVGKGGDSL